MTAKDSGEDLSVAVVVRMKFRSLVQFIFVMSYIVYLTILNIPRTMERYAEYPRWLAFIFIGSFLYFMWILGDHITTYVRMYMDTRSVHGELLVRIKDNHSKIMSTLRGELERKD